MQNCFQNLPTPIYAQTTIILIKNSESCKKSKHRYILSLYLRKINRREEINVKYGKTDKQLANPFMKTYERI